MKVISYLKVNGPALGHPHQSGVTGQAGQGLRELRPTRGKTLIRPLYRRFKNLYVILAIGPEAQVNEVRDRREARTGTPEGNRGPN